MSKRAKKKPRSASPNRDDDPDGEEARDDAQHAGESRVSLSVTVFWMLSALATVLAEVGLLGTFAAIQWMPMDAETRGQAQLVFGVLYQSAVVCGILALGLTWLASRWRDTPAPREVTAFVLLVAGAPPLSLVIAWVLKPFLP